MHTSYFRNWKNIPREKAVAICQGVPKWYTGQRNLTLAPSWEMIHLKDPQEYERRYSIILSKLNPKKEYEAIEAMVGGNAIILCWEKDRRDCHRLQVARWFEETLGIEVPEFPLMQPGLL